MKGESPRTTVQYHAEQSADGVAFRPALEVREGTLWREPSELSQLFHLMTVVAVVVVAAHSPVFKCDALCFDDDQYVIGNPLVQDVGLASTSRFFTEVFTPSTVQGYYQPLSMISLMVDYALAGQSGTLYTFHRTALVLHVANTLLLILLFYLLFRNPWAAAVAGLLFGLHPVTAETVAWISERKTLLASFFSLWSLICYVLHAQKGQRYLYAGSIVLYTLALLCKPTAVMLPAVMILLDIWPLRRFPGVRRTAADKAPLFAICLLSAVVTYVSQSRSGGVRLPGEYGIWRVPLILCHNLVFYLQKISWPIPLSPFYSYPEPFVPLHPRVLLGLAGTFILLIVLVLSLRKTRAVVIGFLMFFLLLLPTMQIVGFSDEIAANRFLYLPFFGLLLLLASSCSWLFPRIEGHETVLSRWVLIAIFLGVGAAETRCLRSYLGHWRDTRTLYEHMLAVSPRAYKAYNNLGVALLGQGATSEAIKCFTLAVKFAGGPVCGARAYVNLGQTLIQTGNTRLGLGSLRQVVYGCPQFHYASLYLAWILATHPDTSVLAPAEAIELTERVARTSNHPPVVVLDTLAAAYAANGQFAQAVETAKKAFDSAVARNEGRLAEEIQERLGLYRCQQRYCKDPAVAAWAKASP